MKKTYFFLCLLIIFGISVRMNAQIDPGTANLTHQWTFDDGTPKDVVGTCDGTLMGGATISNSALNTTAGGYLSLPGTTIGINGYSAITTEIWFTSSSGSNGGYTMLDYFGTTTGTLGYNYISTSAARGDGNSRAAISSGTYDAETYVNGTKYDDGKLHQMVAVYSATAVTFYIDGLSVGTVVNAIPLSSLSNDFAYLAKGGYTGDPTWKGLIHKFSLYNKDLTADEVLFLFQKGPEAQSVITANVSSLAFDSNYPAEIFSVSSANLASDITVTAPTGITVSPATISKNLTDQSVTVVYDATKTVNGNITLTSGNTVVTIPVKSADDSKCYTPLYTNVQNILGDLMGMNSMTGFGGWGTRSVSTIITDSANVYCGAASISIGDGINTGSGSLDVAMAGILIPNTTYHVKVMIKTLGGTFHLGVDAAPNVEKAIDTNGEWKPLEFTFTTGATLVTNPVMYINNWACTGLKAWVDNYELYVSPDQVISTSTSGLAFDPEFKSDMFTVTGANLSSDITLTAPAGITLSKTTLPMAAAGDTVLVTYDGTTNVKDSIVLTSGTKVIKIPVSAINTSNTACFTPLYTDRPNMVLDPYMNDLSKFGGWGGRSLISIANAPDSVYCGSHSGLVANSGSMDVVLTGRISPNTVYVSRAWVRSVNGSFQLGVYGIGTPADVTDTIDTHGVWQQMQFEFTTGATLGTTSGLYFNNWGRTGKRGYIDNWELYRKDTVSAVASVKDLFDKVYVQNGKIVADFDLTQSSLVRLSVYSIQGALVSDDKFNAIAGRNKKVVNANLPSGMYLVKMTQNGQYSFRKVIK